MDTDRTNLLQTDGGPILCIRSDLARNWGGIEWCSDALEMHTHSDYERACQFTDYFNIIDVMGTHAIVLGDMPLMTGVCANASDSTFVFYRIVFSDSVCDAKEFSTGDSYTRDYPAIEKADFSADSNHYTMFDSATAGDKVRVYLNFEVSIGKYTVCTYHINRLERMELIIHRATKV
jgi:hypothetical protein